MRLFKNGDNTSFYAYDTGILKRYKCIIDTNMIISEHFKQDSLLKYLK